jgi:uncharacterized protein (DUF849 family)
MPNSLDGRVAIIIGGSGGIEDGIYLSRGVLTPSNTAMVTKIRGIAEALGSGIATSAETRDMLGLPQPSALL